MKKRYCRKMKQYVMAGIMAVLVLVTMIMIARVTQKEKLLKYSEDYVALAELPSQLSFTFYDETQWRKIAEKINGGEKLNGKLTYGKMEALLKQLSVQEYITYDKKASGKNVTRKQWNTIYAQVLDLLDTEGSVTAVNLVFLTEKAAKDGGELEGKRLTQLGYYEMAQGVDYFGYFDTYQVYVKDQRIIGVNSVCKEPVTLENVFIHTAKDEKAEILYESQKISLDIEGLTEEITDTICDVEWQENKVKAIYKKEEMIRGKVLSFNDTQIEISGYGTLEHAGKLKIYKTYGTVEQLDESKLVIGNLEADFVVAEKQVCGIILKQPAAIEMIRVLLLNSTSSYHPNAMFVSDTDSTVTIGEQVHTIPAGQIITVSALLPEGSAEFAKIALSDGSSRLFLADETGKRLSQGYRGTIEVRRYPEGYGIVNELSLEQYLYGVIPSEMPASYETEALRAQAVCARSYACIQLMAGDYAALGAHVDDSTNYQVYNKKEENAATNLAVDDTIGEVLKYNGEIAEAYYFSTSCGHTESIAVWNVTPDEQTGYLQGVSMLTDGSQPDFSSEEVFAEFIKNKEISAFDSDAAFFRWEAKLDVNGKKEAWNAAILSRKQVSASNVQIVKTDGTEASESEFASFGSVTGISVEERSSGGCIAKLRISYEQGSVLLLTEYNIRYVLGKATASITDQNGKAAEMALLPSAYCTIVPIEQGYVIYGGGYGHGIGMSQNGANGMAKAGMAYVDILTRYYSGISIENIY